MTALLRLFAFLVDFIFFVPLTFSFCFFVSLFTNTEIDNYAINIFFVPIAIAIFERFYDGVTPGRFIMKIRLVSTSQNNLIFQSYLIRLFVLFIFVPACVFLIGLVRFLVGDLNVFYYDYHLSIAIFIIFYGFLMVFTAGQQSFHDYLARTSVVRVGRSPTRIINRRVLFWPALFSVIILNVALFFVPDILDSENVDYFREQTGIMTESSLDHMDDMIFSTPDIDSGNPDFFDYYDGYHSFLGYVNLKKTDKKFGFSGFYEFEEIPEKAPHVPAYSVLTTPEGVSNNKFMDEVSLRVFDYAYSQNGHRGALISFVSHKSYLNLFHQYTVIPRLVVLIPAGETDYFWPIVLPGNGGVSTLTLMRTPVEAIMSSTTSGLR